MGSEGCSWRNVPFLPLSPLVPVPVPVLMPEQVAQACAGGEQWPLTILDHAGAEHEVRGLSATPPLAWPLPPLRTAGAQPGSEGAHHIGSTARFRGN